MFVRTMDGGLLNLDQVSNIELETRDPHPDALNDAMCIQARLPNDSTITIDVYETRAEAKSHLDELARLLGAVTIGLNLNPNPEVENA
jgi:hypothetical protein